MTRLLLSTLLLFTSFLSAMETYLSPMEKLFLAAAEAGATEHIKTCIAQNININVRHPKTDETALVCACRWGKYDAAVLLLERPDIDVNASSSKLWTGYTPLHHVFRRSDFIPKQKAALANLLMQKKANSNALADGKVTVLEVAIDNATRHDTPVIQQLIDAGATMASNSIWESPLAQSTYKIKPYLIPLLLKSPHCTKRDIKGALHLSEEAYRYSLAQKIAKVTKYLKRIEPNDANELQAQLDLIKLPPRNLATAEQIPLKVLNCCWNKLQEIVEKTKDVKPCFKGRLKPIPPGMANRIYHRLKKSFDHIAPSRTQHNMLCAYYKTLRLMQHTQLGPEQQTSRLLRLPTDILKMITANNLPVPEPAQSHHPPTA